MTDRVDQASVLVADDQEDVRTALRLLLKGEGFEIQEAASPDETLAAVATRCFDLALIDLNYTRDTTSGREGLDLLASLQARAPGLPVLVMTAWGTIDLAVEAMRRGARDFVLKPWDNALLVEAIRTAVSEGSLQAERKEREEAAARDLERAHRVQARFLPKNIPAMKTLRCATACVQAGEVGGDAYDFLSLGPGRLGILLADASGKGVSAALLMATLRGILHGQWAAGIVEPLASLRTAHEAFRASAASASGYATLFLGLYSEDEGLLEYVNCGHPAPRLLHCDGQITRLEPTAPVIGLLERWYGTIGSCRLQSGETLLAYSDGVTEAGGGRSEEFGEQRLDAALHRHAAGGPQELVDAVQEEVRQHLDGPPEDDMTLLALQAL